MLNRFYEFVLKKKYSNRFFKSLAENGIYKFVMYRWNVITFCLRERPKLQQNTNDFYQKNAARAQAITDMLADDHSKAVYSGMIKYRQTIQKKFYPIKYAEQSRAEYFINEIKLEQDEVFIDCGAYDGDTVDRFLHYCSNYKQIVAFEPGAVNFEHLHAKHGNNPKIMLINAGVWSKSDKLCFSGIDAGVGGSFVDASSGIFIDVKSIDELQLERVTFIKMDIEGAELNALKGAKETILRDKPKLAICIYHSDNDMLDIPEYIHNLVPEYKFYVRQHSPYPFMFDTVLYALL